MKILVVEDNASIQQMICMVLQKEQFVVDTADNGTTAFQKAKSQKYDVIILDLMLPEKSGFEVISALRSLKNNVPILVISARSEVDDRIRTLNLGADDYLVKDFALSELVARVKSLIRRSNGESKNIFFCGNLTLNLSDMVVRRAGITIQLTKKEFIILTELIRKKNKIVSTQELITAAWGEGDRDVLSNKLNVHVRALRQKVEEPFEKKLIHTVRGFGYRLSEEC